MGREMQGIVTTDEAQFYWDMYGQQYKFRVIGMSNKDINIPENHKEILYTERRVDSYV
jgi:hypothetical protein